MRLLLPPSAGELIYCPYHRVWEVFIGEDPALCEYCCQFQPCSMHGEDENGELVIIGPDAVDTWDPFAGEQDSPREIYRQRKEVRDWVDINDI